VTAGELPLSDIRVLDLTMAWAGPMAVRLLADMGAEVVKVEGAAHMDRWRGGTLAQRGTARYPDHDPGAEPWNRNAFFNTQNRNKRTLALDLKQEEGKEILRRLVARADVVAENFSAGAMGRLGLDYPALKEIKPDIVMLSMPALGRTGPERDYIAHGPTVEELAGTTYLQGYRGECPLASGGFAWGDPIAGMNGALAVMIALRNRARTGRGQQIDLSHIEASVAFNAAAIIDYQRTGEDPGRLGASHPRHAPHGVYPCAGEDRWIAIAVTATPQWAALCREMDRSAWVADGHQYWDEANRKADEVVIDAEISRWTRKFDHLELTHRLQAVGVPAGALLSAGELAEDPHLAARGYFELIDHPVAGTHRYPGMAWKLGSTPGRVRYPAPLFGQHNAEVLTELGIPEAEIARLEREEVIASAPHPQGD
jgi:crotonobetainyl-CoA:carnitine CoA-transferase CaiB-like acyl-CoA transferase